MSKKGGYYCAFKNCRGLSRRDKRSFFRFPKDPQRSKEWVKACDRNDLLEKTPLELFNSYRVCAKHFMDSMFLNDLRNRLQPNSVPMQLEPSEDSNDAAIVNGANGTKDLLSDSHDSVTKILSNCVLQKISADEFYKATGIRINEPVSAIKATEEYLHNSSPVDHIYSSTKANDTSINTGNELAVNIGNENSNGFPVESLTYQDLINSLPLSLINGSDTESAMEASELSFLISDKNVEVERIPDAILEGQNINSPLNNISNTYELLEEINQTGLNIVKGKSEEATQTEIDFIEKKLEDKISQTEIDSVGNDLDKNFQIESNFVGKPVESATQTTSSYIKDKLNNRKLKKILVNKKHEIKQLKCKLQKSFINIMDDITLEQFQLLTQKFFPTETSEFIKIQAQLFKEKDNNRSFTLDFKKQCLSLLLTGPKTYKYLQKIFCLPRVHDLQTLKF